MRTRRPQEVVEVAAAKGTRFPEIVPHAVEDDLGVALGLLEAFAQNAAQSYISIADMTDELRADHSNRVRLRDLMLDALEEARRLEAPTSDAVARRVSIAFISLRAALH